MRTARECNKAFPRRSPLFLELHLRRLLDGGGIRQPDACDDSSLTRSLVALPPLDSAQWQSPVRAFAWGVSSVASTVLSLVLFATYLGIGALAHDTNFSLGWVLGSTLLVWAGPAQIILISTLGSGATAVQAAIAVTVSAIRLFPMVVSVLPLLKTPQTRRRHLVLATHFIAVTLWVECYRLLPKVPRDRRIAFTHGLGCGLLVVCMVATTIGIMPNLKSGSTTAFLKPQPSTTTATSLAGSRSLALDVSRRSTSYLRTPL